VPVSNINEFPPVVADVNLEMKFVVPLMFAAPAGPCDPVAPATP
jgi:hypothetical protein